MKDTDTIDQERQRRGAELAADMQDAISFPPLPPSPAEVGDLILQKREHVQALGWGNREHLYSASQVRAYAAQEVTAERNRIAQLVAGEKFRDGKQDARRGPGAVGTWHESSPMGYVMRELVRVILGA